MKSFPAYWNDTGHTQLNDGATLIDLGVSWSPAKDVDIYGSIQNLTNVQYLAHGLHADVVRRADGQCRRPFPALGMPLTAIAGLEGEVLMAGPDA